MTEVVGRDAELASLREFVERIAAGSVAFVLEGDAGMGKTTLWRAAVEHAEEAGQLVLKAQPVESETTLSYTGIGDLLEPVFDEVVELLPPAQRRALSRALAVGEDEDVPLDPRALRVALMNALRALAGDRPVLIAIDDSQWLDYASSAGLAYAVRRFRSDRIGLLLSRRSGLESALLDELLRSPAAERFTRVDVGALDVSALGRAIHDRLGTMLARPLLVEVHTAAGGNPFYALEIVRMLQRTGTSIEAGQPVPLPDTLQELVRGRILALPTESRDFLLAAAAHAHPTIAITETASGVHRGVGLGPALEAGVVELDRDRIRFTHPLLAAGVYEAANPLRRIDVHARLADLLEDVEARAWQLAASVDEPAEDVARTLEDAAEHARARGALRPAALLLDRARELTTAGDAEAAVRRGVDASFLHFEAGDSRRAETQLGALVGELAPGAVRARALVRLARVRSYEAQSEAVGLFLRAVDEAEGDEETLAAAHEGVAACLFRLRERLPEAVEHAESAARSATRLGDQALAAEATGTKLICETLLGALAAPETANRALALQDVCSDRRVLAQPLFAFGVYAWWTDDVAGAREIMLQLLQRARELGDESSLPYVLVLLGRIECQLGLYASAAERARDGQEAAEQSGQRALFAYNLALEALVAAHLGSVDNARAAGFRALELVPETGGRPPEHLAREALGHLELASGEPAAAVTWLEPAVQFARAQSISEPGALRFTIDVIEAMIEAARTEDARDVLGWLEGNARRLERVSALASCARCRGLLAAQEGDLDTASTAFDEALGWHAKVELPLDRGRTLLALGAAQRRAKRRREARVTLDEALAVFETIGAALWAERARAELKRISGRAATPGALTPAEERVAALVAEGKTNHEVAAALFLSDRTVEGHLSRVFGKLGIRHRADVRAALEARDSSASAEVTSR